MLQPMTKAVGTATLRLEKHAPKILMGLGIVGYGATVIDGCRSSMMVPGVLDIYEKEHKGDKAWLYRKLAAMYGRTVALFVLSTLCVAKGYGIINERYLGAVEDAMGLREGFMMYRQAVRKDLGEAKDLEYMYGISEKKDIEEHEDGTIDVQNTGEYRKLGSAGAAYSIYARIFDETNPNWTKDPQQNLVFLKAQQQYANDMLHVQGYLFLSDVYKALGFDETDASRIVGWTIENGHDNYIDFGMYNLMNVKANEFINGYERSVVLDFNVDGVIFKKLKKQ